MNDLIGCGIKTLETVDLVNLYREFKERQLQATADYKPGLPVLFGAITDYLAAEIGRRYIHEEEKEIILAAAN